jgi:ATP-binding cassette subfamily B multidrug efflux pump
MRPGAPTRPGGRGPMGNLAMPTEKSLDFWPSVKRLGIRMRSEKAGLVSVIVLAVISVGMFALGPRILGHATDVIFDGVVSQQFSDGLTKEEAIESVRANGNDTYANTLEATDLNPGGGIDTNELTRALLAALALFVGGSLLGILQGFVLSGIVQRTVRKLRSDVADKLNRLPLSYFDTRTRGEVLSNVTNDIDNVAQSLQQTLSQLLTSLLMVIGTVTMMVVISPLLAVIGLVSVPISLIVTRAVAKRSQPQYIAQWRHLGELNGHVEETLTGHSVVKAFGRQRESQQMFDAKNDQLYQASFSAQVMSGVILPSLMFVGNLNYVLLAVVGSIRVTSGVMTLGDVQAFIQYSRQFTQPLSQVASMANVMQSGVASVERVFDILDADEMGVDPAATGVVTRDGRVQFDHVAFSYKPDMPLIHDLSLIAEPGHTVAIVGPTGAGKTTLVNLIMRFYEIHDGRITLDGIDIRSMNRHDLRKNTGMVLQDTWLFGGTILDNIRYGKLDATDDDVITAARATHVDRFVQSLPDGYNTVIDDEGSNISAGEKQLITIARAFLAQPALLILDEATSSVDTRTEVSIQHAMAALRADRTSFVIAHRLSTVRDADLILMMDNGRIVEQGTHEALLGRNGAYASLYNSQYLSAE